MFRLKFYYNSTKIIDIQNDIMFEKNIRDNKLTIVLCNSNFDSNTGNIDSYFMKYFQ